VPPKEPKYKFTLLDPNIHDRAAFSCGEPLLDGYLKKSANKDASLYLGRPHVMTAEDNDNEIIGYYTLSNYAIIITDLPEDQRKRLPERRPIPTTLLGMMAIDERFQGQGLGEYLFFDALYRALRVSERDQASFAVVIDALNDKAKRFYLKYDAKEFLDRPSKLFITMKKIRQRFTELGLHPQTTEML
jgi:GNAT superfamily N-acetyltransferase